MFWIFVTKTHTKDADDGNGASNKLLDTEVQQWHLALMAKVAGAMDKGAKLASRYQYLGITL